MKILPHPQGSTKWLYARAGVVTASEFHNLVTPKWKIRTGDTVQTYLCRKVAERWLHGPLPGWSSTQTEFGKILEQEAVPWYELEYNTTIARPGLITTDDGRVGCSPDGLLQVTGSGADIRFPGGLEIKCPEAPTHIGYLLDGGVPDAYAAQVHGAMYVTGAQWWQFLSYRRNFPPLLVTVQRDDEIQTILEDALDNFLTSMDSALARLEQKNGGPSEAKSEVWEAPEDPAWLNEPAGVSDARP